MKVYVAVCSRCEYAESFDHFSQAERAADEHNAAAPHETTIWEGYDGPHGIEIRKEILTPERRDG